MSRPPKQDSLTSSMDALTQEKIIETAPPPMEPEIQTKLTNRQLADQMNLRYIEPARKLAPLGKLPEYQKAEHAYMWEYVKGIYENYDFVGETLTFFLCLYPGDPDCLWHIPANVPVFVPRMVAKHLEECQQYHTFKYKELPQNRKKELDFNDEFAVDQTHYRGKFRPIGAFA